MRPPNYLAQSRPGFLPPPGYYHPTFRAPPPPPGYSHPVFRAPPPPPGIEQGNPISQPCPPPVCDYYDQRNQRYISVPTHNNGSQPPPLKRPSMAEQLVLKKHRTESGEGFKAGTPSRNSIPAVTPPSTQQLSIVVSSTPIPPPPTSSPPPVPPPPTSPSPESPRPASPPPLASLAPASPQCLTEPTPTPPLPLPTSPLPASQSSPSAGPASPPPLLISTSPSKSRELIPAPQKSAKGEGFQSTESMFPASPPSSSARPVSPPSLTVPASQPQLDEVAPAPPESTKPIDQSQDFQDRQIVSPLLSWLATFDSQHNKEILGIKETNMHVENHHTLDTHDMEGTHLSCSGNSWEVPLEIPSSPEETKPDISTLARLKPPPKSPMLEPSKLSHERMNLVPPVVSHLVFELTNTSNANSMIKLANGTFAYLDSLEVGYLPFYEAVHAFISYHCEKEALEIQKKGRAFATRARHHELVNLLSDAELVQSRAHIKVKNIHQKLAPLRARTEELRELLRKAEEELEEVEEELADAEAEEVLCNADYSRARADVIAISPEMDKAEVIIDGVERRWNEAEARIKRKRDELLLLRK